MRVEILHKPKKDSKRLKFTQLLLTLSNLMFLNQKSDDKIDVYELTLKFNFNIISSKLTKTSHYSSYQQKLFRLVKFLKFIKKITTNLLSENELSK